MHPADLLLKMLIDLVSGASVLIRPYMEDENGCYNEEKTLNLIDELMNALKTYLCFARATQITDYGDDDQISIFMWFRRKRKCVIKVLYTVP